MGKRQKLFVTIGLAAGLGLAAPQCVSAHPHIFIDADVQFDIDSDGKLLGVTIDWHYDDYFSLTLSEDLGVDSDGDLVLTAEDQTLLDEGMLQWPDEFVGDLYLKQGDSKLALDRPTRHSATLGKDGRLRETLYRALAVPVATDQPVTIRMYDPSLYSAYTISRNFDLPKGCTVTYQEADTDAANAKVIALLGVSAAEVPADQTMPDFGDLFADTMILTCAGF